MTTLSREDPIETLRLIFSGMREKYLMFDINKGLFVFLCLQPFSFSVYVVNVVIDGVITAEEFRQV